VICPAVAQLTVWRACCRNIVARHRLAHGLWFFQTHYD
jgi:hypothetical protein